MRHACRTEAQCYCLGSMATHTGHASIRTAAQDAFVPTVLMWLLELRCLLPLTPVGVRSVCSQHTNSHTFARLAAALTRRVSAALRPSK